jgi:hypothetical protein
LAEEGEEIVAKEETGFFRRGLNFLQRADESRFLNENYI